MKKNKDEVDTSVFDILALLPSQIKLDPLIVTSEVEERLIHYLLSPSIQLQELVLSIISSLEDQTVFQKPMFLLAASIPHDCHQKLDKLLDQTFQTSDTDISAILSANDLGKINLGMYTKYFGGEELFTEDLDFRKKSCLQTRYRLCKFMKAPYNPSTLSLNDQYLQIWTSLSSHAMKLLQKYSDTVQLIAIPEIFKGIKDIDRNFDGSVESLDPKNEEIAKFLHEHQVFFKVSILAKMHRSVYETLPVSHIIRPMMDMLKMNSMEW